ncbi:MAG TPA: polyprenol monophosphomannose synthase [Acidimicrobiia bacterium]|nr:polyprenol monophosphomannose synthase [Acidimicrobiia bacterium]
MRALIVTPTYEESENIVEFLQRTRTAAPDADILVVDDNSPDGTAALADEVGARLGHIEVLRRPSKIGIGDAVRAGFTLGIDRGYDIVVQIDADLSHDPAALPALLGEIESGSDAAIGSRYVPGGSIPHWPWYRRAVSKWGNRYATLMLGIPIRDATSGYRAFRADILKTSDYGSTRSKGYGFQIELCYRVWRHGGRIAQVPITFTDRVRGHSKMSLSVGAEELGLVTWWGFQDRVLKGRWRR